MSSEAERKARRLQSASRRRAVLRSLLLHGGLAALMVLYTLAGAYTFMQLEGPFEGRARADVQTARQQLLTTISFSGRKGVDQQNWTVLVDKSLSNFENTLETAIRQGASTDPLLPQKWDLWGSLFYVSTVYTTIGYGNVAPTTTAGRVATIIYACFGIPLCLVLLSHLGNLAATAIKAALRTVQRCFANPRRSSGTREPYAQPPWLDDGSIESLRGGVVWTVVAILLALYIAFGVWIYGFWEDWTSLEALYFIFISLTTIGFGDIVPLKPAHFMLSSVYVFFGLALVSTAFSIIQSSISDSVAVAHNKAHQLLGIPPDEEEKEAPNQSPLTTQGVATNATS